jgi:hypothetical protein
VLFCVVLCCFVLFWFVLFCLLTCRRAINLTSNTLTRSSTLILCTARRTVQLATQSIPGKYYL